LELLKNVWAPKLVAVTLCWGLQMRCHNCLGIPESWQGGQTSGPHEETDPNCPDCCLVSMLLNWMGPMVHTTRRGLF
jgi:hypothetical protein